MGRVGLRRTREREEQEQEQEEGEEQEEQEEQEAEEGQEQEYRGPGYTHRFLYSRWHQLRRHWLDNPQLDVQLRVFVVMPVHSHATLDDWQCYWALVASLLPSE
jgi:hypothetical protein